MLQLSKIEDTFYGQYFGKIRDIQQKREEQTAAARDAAMQPPPYPGALNPFTPGAGEPQKPAAGVVTSSGSTTVTGVPVGAPTNAKVEEGVVRDNMKSAD